MARSPTSPQPAEEEPYGQRVRTSLDGEAIEAGWDRSGMIARCPLYARHLERHGGMERKRRLNASRTQIGLVRSLWAEENTDPFRLRVHFARFIRVTRISLADFSCLKLVRPRCFHIFIVTIVMGQWSAPKALAPWNTIIHYRLPVPGKGINKTSGTQPNYSEITLAVLQSYL